MRVRLACFFEAKAWFVLRGNRFGGRSSLLSGERGGLSWADDHRNRPYRAVLLLVPVLSAVWAVLRMPFGLPMPGYWIDALEMANTGVIRQHFTPSGYPLTVALGMLLTPGHPAYGLVAEQAVLHVLLALVLWAVMRRLGASARAALVGMVLLEMDPELVSSVMKVWDVAFSTLLLLLIALAALRVLQRGAGWMNCALLGAAWAYGCFDRPNFVSLLPALGLALWWAQGIAPARVPGGHRWARMAKAGGVLLAVAGLTYPACSMMAYRSVRTPGNGPYNLFAGNNPYSKAALLEHLNAEPSIVPALAADRVDMTGLMPDSAALDPYYRVQARAFALHRPGAEMELAGVKLFTLLRPDTKVHPLLSPSGFAKGLLALFVPCWLGVVLWCWVRHRAKWWHGDTLVMVLVVLYVLPFLVTNADPRFRTPLDLLVAAHCVSLLWRRAGVKMGWVGELRTVAERPTRA